ncbi:MAG: hypothetical protein L0I88_04800 [Alkalibacterium sp.]|nr:hypothetical protein [Alkalibacterium sp.]
MIGDRSAKYVTLGAPPHGFIGLFIMEVFPLQLLTWSFEVIKYEAGWRVV